MRFSSFNIALSVWALCLTVFTAHGQLTNSPYSRFGLGELQSAASIQSLGMGGVSSSLADPNVINMNNPATYGYLQRTAFQAGIGAQTTTSSSQGNTSTYRDGMLNELALAFKRYGGKWTYVLGLTPYSSTGYSVAQKATINDSLNATYKYKGNGGINRFTAGVNRQFQFTTKHRADSSNVLHRLQFGLQLQYYFGKLEYVQRVLYGRTDTYDSRVYNDLKIGDMTLQAGFHYWMPLTSKREGGKTISSKHLLFGGSYTLGQNMKATYSQLYENIVTTTTGAEFAVDTALFVKPVGGRVTIPQRLQGGISMLMFTRSNSTILVGTEFIYQQWSAFRSTFNDAGTNFPLNDMLSAAVGVEFTPKPTDAGRNFFSRCTYRVGARNTQTYIQVRGNQIVRNSLSAGVSMPMLSSKSPGSRMHFGVEYGTNGTQANGLLQERFVHAYIGVTLTPHISNPWFNVRKYD